MFEQAIADLALDASHAAYIGDRWRDIVASVLDDVTDPEGCFEELYRHFARPEAWTCDPQAAPVLEQLAARGLVLGLASNYDHRLRPVAAGKPWR